MTGVQTCALPIYKEALDEFGQPVPEELPMMREMYVAEDRETAYIQSQPYLEAKYEADTAWGQDKALPGEESFRVPYRDLAKNRILVGSHIGRAPWRERLSCSVAAASL